MVAAKVILVERGPLRTHTVITFWGGLQALQALQAQQTLMDRKIVKEIKDLHTHSANPKDY